MPAKIHNWEVRRLILWGVFPSEQELQSRIFSSDVTYYPVKLEGTPRREIFDIVEYGLAPGNRRFWKERFKAHASKLQPQHLNAFFFITEERQRAGVWENV